MSEALEPVLTAGRVGFALDRFEFVSGERFEVHGSWSGVRGRRFMRPALTLSVGGRSTRLLADLAHKPWDAEDGEPWTAAFPYSLEAGEVHEAELTVGPDVTIRLPAPGGSGTVSGERRPKRPAAEAAAEHDDSRVDDQPGGGLDGEALRRALELARQERDAARRDREQALKEASSARIARERALADRETALRAQTQAVEKRDAAVAERDEAVAARHAAVAARERAAAERDAALADRDRAAAERDRARAERDRAVTQARAERDRAVTEWRAALVVCNEAEAERQVAAVARDALVSERDALHQTIRLVESECAQSIEARDRAIAERDAALAARDAAVAAREEPARAGQPRALDARRTLDEPSPGIVVPPRLQPVEPLRSQPRELFLPRAVAITVLLIVGLVLLIVLRIL